MGSLGWPRGAVASRGRQAAGHVPSRYDKDRGATAAPAFPSSVWLHSWKQYTWAEAEHWRGPGKFVNATVYGLIALVEFPLEVQS